MKHKNNSKLIEAFGKELLDKILQCQIFEIPAGTRTKKPKDYSVEFIPIVIEGVVHAIQKDSFSNDVLVYDIKPAQSCIISINSTFTNNPIILESYAPVDTKLVLVPKEMSLKWFDEYPKWRNFVMGLYTKRLNELVKQHNTVSEQKVAIEDQNQKMTDSINYAKRIQEAVFPAEHFITDEGWEHFIFFKPRDIVSGDFYWIAKEDDKIIIVAADATGHGVPGAFMSMLGIAFLNEIKESIMDDKLSSSQILEQLRAKVKNALKQTGKMNEARDGMDVALCIIDTETNILQFSGAHNPLYIIKKIDGEKSLITLKAERQPIGIHIKERPFTTTNFQLEENDAIYMFSDGFADQFNGKTGEKFKSRRFKELLKSVSDKKMKEQKQILIETFNDWKEGTFQIDDVLVMGVKI